MGNMSNSESQLWANLQQRLWRKALGTRQLSARAQEALEGAKPLQRPGPLLTQPQLPLVAMSPTPWGKPCTLVLRKLPFCPTHLSLPPLSLQSAVLNPPPKRVWLLLASPWSPSNSNRPPRHSPWLLSQTGPLLLHPHRLQREAYAHSTLC